MSLITSRAVFSAQNRGNDKTGIGQGIYRKQPGINVLFVISNIKSKTFAIGQLAEHSKSGNIRLIA